MGTQKKIVSALLVLMLIFTICSCGNKKETSNVYGNVTPIGSTSEKDYSEFNIFNTLDEPLGYQYSTIENGRAMFSMLYPKTWNITSESDNHFVITPPAKEALMKEVTIHVLTDFNSSYDIPSAENAIRIFSNTLSTLPFQLNNQGYVKLPYDNPEDYSTAENIIENSPDTLLVTTDQNLQYMTIGGDLVTNGEEMINRCYYINWQNRPTLIYGVGKLSDSENICKLMDYMVSSIKYIDAAGISKTKEIKSLNDKFAITFSLPSDWKKSKMNTKGLFADAIKYCLPDGSTSPYGGMTVSIYSTDRRTLPEINKDYIKENLLNIFALNYYSENVSDSDFFNDYYIEEVPADGLLDGKTYKEFKAQTLIRKTNNSANTIQDLTVHNSEIIVLYDDDHINVIVISSLQSQADIAKKISELVRSTLSVK
jgi:hypothetical protein